MESMELLCSNLLINTLKKVLIYLEELLICSCQILIIIIYYSLINLEGLSN
jgi:hypothetical protein